MEKHSKKLAWTSIVSSIVAIIAIITRLIKWVWSFAVNAEQFKDIQERKERTEPVIEELKADTKVIKNDVSWIKEYLKQQ